MHSGGFPLLLYPGIIYVNLELFISWKISKTQQRSSVSPGLFSQLDAFSTSVSISLMGIGLFRYFIVSWVCGSVQSLSRVRLFATPWIAARHASLAITNSRSSPRLTSIESVMPSSHLILCRPLLLPTIPPSIRVFSNESTLPMRWPKYWSFSFTIIPFQRNPGADLLQNGLVGSPCSPRDSQESSPTPQFKSIHSSAFSLLYSPTLTSTHDHRKNHSLD